MSPAKTTKPIAILFEMLTQVGPRNCSLGPPESASQTEKL